MPEPASDDVDLDASLEKVNGGGVAEDVRADRSAGARVILRPHRLHKRLEPAVRLPQQAGRDGEVDGRRGRVDMTHERR